MLKLLKSGIVNIYITDEADKIFERCLRYSHPLTEYFSITKDISMKDLVATLMRISESGKEFFYNYDRIVMVAADTFELKFKDENGKLVCRAGVYDFRKDLLIVHFWKVQSKMDKKKREEINKILPMKVKEVKDEFERYIRSRHFR